MAVVEIMPGVVQIQPDEIISDEEFYANIERWRTLIANRRKERKEREESNE